MLSRVKKNDTVLVKIGKDKGKQGSVISVNPKEDSALIKGVGVVTRHLKARKSGEQGRISKEETYIPLCKVMPVCPACKKACRIQTKLLEGGKKARTCHRCKEAF